MCCAAESTENPIVLVMHKRKYSIFSSSSWEWKVIHTTGSQAFSVVLGLDTKAMLHFRGRHFAKWVSNKLHNFFGQVIDTLLACFVFCSEISYWRPGLEKCINKVHNFKLKSVLGKKAYKLLLTSGALGALRGNHRMGGRVGGWQESID